MGKLKNGCSIYLVFAGKKVKLPVNPEEIETKHPTNHKTYDVIGVVNTHTPFSSASLISLLSKQTSSVRITHAVPTRLATAITLVFDIIVTQMQSGKA